MKPSSVNARVRCKHCRAKVPLSPARVKELGAKLALTLDCPACGKVFTTALLCASRRPHPLPPPRPYRRP